MCFTAQKESGCICTLKFWNFIIPFRASEFGLRLKPGFKFIRTSRDRAKGVRSLSRFFIGTHLHMEHADDHVECVHTIASYPPVHPILSNLLLSLIFVKNNFDKATRKNVCYGTSLASERNDAT